MQVVFHKAMCEASLPETRDGTKLRLLVMYKGSGSKVPRAVYSGM